MPSTSSSTPQLNAGGGAIKPGAAAVVTEPLEEEGTGLLIDVFSP
jgi:hypothetical protein